MLDGFPCDREPFEDALADPNGDLAVVKRAHENSLN